MSARRLRAGLPRKAAGLRIDRRNRQHANMLDAWGQGRIFSMQQEAFLADPKAALAPLLHGLELDAPADYFVACAAICNPKPSVTRGTVDWPKAERELVERMIAEVPFLAHYRCDDGRASRALPLAAARAAP